MTDPVSHETVRNFVTAIAVVLDRHSGGRA